MEALKTPRLDIQGLRGIAVISIILYHAFENMFYLGYLGVDVFFVISGFVVTPLIQNIIENNSNTSDFFAKLRIFYLKRFYRLAPSLGVAILVTLIVYFFLGNIYSHINLSKQVIATIMMVGNLGAYFFVGDYFHSNPNPLVHTWSLAVEEQIYVLLPILLFVLTLIIKKTKFLYVYSFIFLTSLIVFLNIERILPLLNGLGLNNPSGINFYSPLTRIWEFIGGSLTYFILKRKKSKNKNLNSLIIYSALMLEIICIYLLRNSGFRGLVIYSCLITMFNIYFGVFSKLPSLIQRILVWFGDRSYSLYLVHMPILFLLKDSFYFGGNGNEQVFIFFGLFATLVFGWLLSKYIETPFRVKNNNFSVSKRAGIITFKIYLVGLSFSILMLLGTNNGYWGLEKTIKSPLAAQDLNYGCKIMNDPTDQPCVISKSTIGKTVLLIGDSHASQFAEVLRKTAAQDDWQLVVWTWGDCKIQYTLKLRNSVSKDCVDHNLKVLEWIKINKPNLIIASQYIREEHSLDELQDGLLQIRNINPNLLVIPNTPVFPDYDFMQQGPIFKSIKYEKDFKLTDMDLRDSEMSKSLMEWASHNSVKIIDLNNLYCNKFTCSRWESGNWLYKDRTHLSIIGANLSSPIFSKILQNYDKGNFGSTQ